MLCMIVYTAHFANKHRTQIFYNASCHVWCFALHLKLAECRIGYCDDSGITCVLGWSADTQSSDTGIKLKLENCEHTRWLSRSSKQLFTLLDFCFAWFLLFPVSKVITPQLIIAFHKTGEKSLYCGNHRNGNAMYT